MRGSDEHVLAWAWHELDTQTLDHLNQSEDENENQGSYDLMELVADLAILEEQGLEDLASEKQELELLAG